VDLPWELPHTFLGLDEVAAAFETAGAVILPVPWEATTSYGGGTRHGPRAIVEASRYVELYHRELDEEPATLLGVHTLPALELTRAGPRQAMEELRHSYDRILEVIGDRFLVLLGGEHAVSAPAILSWADRVPGRLSVLQMDAHADLRPEYEGTADSHASAMARVLPAADVVAVGVRGVSQEEVAVSRAAEGSTLIWSQEMQEGGAWMDRALDALGDRVYLTFDVDYLDPSLMPATGTPEPGGGGWHDTLRFLRRLFREKEVVAADVVELAPIPGVSAPDFLAAKLVHELLACRYASLP
jgi:agmatinase